MKAQKNSSLFIVKTALTATALSLLINACAQQKSQTPNADAKRQAAQGPAAPAGNASDDKSKVQPNTETSTPATGSPAPDTTAVNNGTLPVNPIIVPPQDPNSRDPRLKDEPRSLTLSFDREPIKVTLESANKNNFLNEQFGVEFKLKLNDTELSPIAMSANSTSKGLIASQDLSVSALNYKITATGYFSAKNPENFYLEVKVVQNNSPHALQKFAVVVGDAPYLQLGVLVLDNVNEDSTYTTEKGIKTNYSGFIYNKVRLLPGIKPRVLSVTPFPFEPASKLMLLAGTISMDVSASSPKIYPPDNDKSITASLNLSLNGVSIPFRTTSANSAAQEIDLSPLLKINYKLKILSAIQGQSDAKSPAQCFLNVMLIDKSGDASTSRDFAVAFGDGNGPLGNLPADQAALMLNNPTTNNQKPTDLPQLIRILKRSLGLKVSDDNSASTAGDQ